MKWIIQKITELYELNDSPRSIALGAAIGVFVGFLPLFGFKTLLTFGWTKLMRGNLIAAAIAVALHNFCVLLTPLLLLWEYRIGYWFLHRPAHPPTSLPENLHEIASWMNWSTFFEIWVPLFLGSLLLGLPIGIVTGLVIFWSLQRRHSPPSP